MYLIYATSSVEYLTKSDCLSQRYVYGTDDFILPVIRSMANISSDVATFLP